MFTAALSGFDLCDGVGTWREPASAADTLVTIEPLFLSHLFETSNFVRRHSHLLSLAFLRYREGTMITNSGRSFISAVRKQLSSVDRGQDHRRPPAKLGFSFSLLAAEEKTITSSPFVPTAMNI